MSQAEVSEKGTPTQSDQIIVSLGEDKGCFQSPVICLAARPFTKTAACIDLISFDVGTTHLAVARIRYDRAHNRCCIVNAVQMDIYNPWRSLMLDADYRHADGSVKNKRQRKPGHVEPFDGSVWPSWKTKSEIASVIDANNANKGGSLTDFHKRILDEKRVLREKETSQTHRWVHDVELMPLALHNIEWLHDTDIDRVLVEQQQYDNTKMRCISYCLLDMFQTRRLCAFLQQQQQQCEPEQQQNIPALGSHAVLEMFPSTMKLSKWVINILLQSWRVEADQTLALSASQKKQQRQGRQKEEQKDRERVQKENGTESEADDLQQIGVCERTSDEVEQERKQSMRKANRNRNNNESQFLSAKRHDDLVDHATHGTKKTSAVRVLEHLFAPVDHDAHNSDALAGTESRRHDGEGQHPMAHWLDSQRAEKHNVCDAILQAFAWLIKHEQEPAMQRIRKKRKRAVVSTKSRKKAAVARLDSAIVDDVRSIDTK